MISPRRPDDRLAAPAGQHEAGDNSCLAHRVVPVALVPTEAGPVIAFVARVIVSIGGLVLPPPMRPGA